MPIDPTDRAAALVTARRDTGVHLVCLAQIASRLMGDAMLPVLAVHANMRAIGRRLVVSAAGDLIAEEDV